MKCQKHQEMDVFQKITIFCQALKPTQLAIILSDLYFMIACSFIFLTVLQLKEKINE